MLQVKLQAHAWDMLNHALEELNSKSTPSVSDVTKAVEDAVLSLQLAQSTVSDFTFFLRQAWLEEAKVG